MRKINPITYPIIFGIALFILGIFVSGFFELYYKFIYLDTFYHFLGGVVLGWFFYTWLFPIPTANLSVVSFSKFTKLFIVVSAICMVGVFWEYAERLSTIYASVHAPWLYHWFSGGNLNDTLLDLLADMLGGSVFCFFKISSETAAKLD